MPSGLWKWAKARNCELRLVFVVDEEVDGLGTQYYVSHEPPGGRTIAIIGEPTMLEACIAHRGVTRFKVAINGRQCHSGLPYEGINAINQMARFLLEVERFDLDLPVLGLRHSPTSKHNRYHAPLRSERERCPRHQ